MNVIIINRTKRERSFEEFPLNDIIDFLSCNELSYALRMLISGDWTGDEIAIVDASNKEFANMKKVSPIDEYQFDDVITVSGEEYVDFRKGCIYMMAEDKEGTHVARFDDLVYLLLYEITPTVVAFEPLGKWAFKNLWTVSQENIPKNLKDISGSYDPFDHFVNDTDEEVYRNVETSHEDFQDGIDALDYCILIRKDEFRESTEEDFENYKNIEKQKIRYK